MTRLYLPGFYGFLSSRSISLANSLTARSIISESTSIVFFDILCVSPALIEHGQDKKSAPGET